MALIVATQLMLDEARLAYHKVQMGLTARVVVDMNGERVEFSSTNLSRLYQYILILERQLNPLETPGTDGPAMFLF